VENDLFGDLATMVRAPHEGRDVHRVRLVRLLTRGGGIFLANRDTVWKKIDFLFSLKREPLRLPTWLQGKLL
jgi:hypothetical protein